VPETGRQKGAGQKVSLDELLSHPLFRVLQRTGTRGWHAYFHNPQSGHTAWGGGDTPAAALQMAHDAAVVVANSCGDLF